MHFLGSSKSPYGGILSVGLGHELGISIRSSDWFAPDCVFKNLRVFQAFVAASLVRIALTFLLWLMVPIFTFSLMDSKSCCSRSSLLCWVSSCKDFLSDA